MPLKSGTHLGEGCCQVALVGLVPSTGQRGVHGTVTLWPWNAGGSTARLIRMLWTPSTFSRTHCGPVGNSEDSKTSVSVLSRVNRLATSSSSPTTSVTRCVFETFGLHFTIRVFVFTVVLRVTESIRGARATGSSF